MVSEKKGGNFSLIRRIKDDGFNVDQISSYNLLIQISPELFRVCVTDIEKSKCLLLEDYQLAFAYNPNQVIEKLQEIYDDHHILKAGFWKNIKIAVKTSNFTLIPYSLFNQDCSRQYLDLMCNLKDDQSEEVFFYKQKSSDIVNVFSVDKKTVDFFIRAYPGKSIKVLHHTCSFIEAVLLDRNITDKRAMYICMEKNHFTLIIVSNKNLEYCNTFSFFSAEDFVYYIMFVVDQLQFNVDASPLTIWGEITPDSEVYKKIYKYIRNVSLGHKLSGLYFGYPFDEIFDHNFYDLYSMHLCD